MDTISNKVKKIKKILKTQYFPVGVKILQDNQYVKSDSFQDISKNRRFCYYIRAAAHGKSFVIKNDNKLECKTPYFCLGFREPKYADIRPRIEPAATETVLIAPLDKFDTEVDSIVFIINAKQAMLLTDALRRILNKKIDVSFGASMSVCGEAVAYSIVNQKPNFSVLCFGARVYSEYEDDELVLAIPSNLFDALYKKLKGIEILQELEIELKKDVR
ncbi:MAG: DUF169 domain-containing protein [Candidatus Helarchaeota archaeon]